MEYKRLGNSEIHVSQLALGCMSFGDQKSGFNKWSLDANESEEIIKKALDLGINYFDTANSYSNGTSEQYLGQAIRKNVSRDKVIIQTKVYFNEGKLSRSAIFREIDKSLKNIGTDYIDSYVVHRFDYNTPMEETLSALNELVKLGKVRTIGASAMYGYQFHNMQNLAQQQGWTLFSTMQSMFNLLYREDEREMNPICQQYNVALTPYSPLASGRLSRLKHTSRRFETDPVAHAKFDHLPTEAADHDIVMKVAEIAANHEVTMTQVALSWLYAKGATAPIIGATQPEYLMDAVGAVSFKLSEDEIRQLEWPYLPHKIVGAK